MFATPILFGYFVVLIPPAMLVASVQAGHPWATVLCFVVASPITRFAFGVYRPRELRVGERASSMLFALPSLHLLMLLLCLPLAALQLRAGKAEGDLDVAGLALSLWTVMTFGTFPAHELLHRRSKVAALAGSVAAGICGYPLLGLEHAVHHSRPGDSQHPEWARANESIWSFAWRRIPGVVSAATAGDKAMRAAGGWPVDVRPLTLGVFSTAAVALFFGVVAGTQGLVVYACAASGVFFSMQVLTYVQHWGLGEDRIENASVRELAWEDDCLMQAWITMNNSFHMAHHHEAQVPYYFLQPAPSAPRQPGCYVIMLGACLVPSVWRHLMLPVLAAFVDGRPIVCDPGRRVVCITPSRRLPNPASPRTLDTEAEP